MSNYTTVLTSDHILQQIPAICFWKDLHSVYRGGNKELLLSNGFTDLEEVLGRTDYDLEPFYMDADKYTHQDKLTLEGKISFNIAKPLQKDGTRGLHLIKKSPVLDEYNQIVGVLGIGFSFTKENYHSIFELLATMNLKVSDFISSVDERNIFLSYNNVDFTTREAQVVTALLRGNTAASIANILFLSRKTVEYHIEKIKQKLECTKRSELVKKAFEFGFIELMFLNII